MEKFFSTHQVAKMCQVSRGSVIRWIHEGKLSAAVTMGGHHRISASDISDLLNTLGLPIPAQVKSSEEKDQKLTVLIIDDDAAICQMLRSFFNKLFPDFCVEAACEGFEAGLMAQSLKPDLILLDLNLPGMDGYLVCEKIRQQRDLAHTKIIAITGGEKEEAQKKISELGADDFLMKPLELGILEQKVIHHLNLNAAEPRKLTLQRGKK